MTDELIMVSVIPSQTVLAKNSTFGMGWISISGPLNDELVNVSLHPLKSVTVSIASTFAPIFGIGDRKV